MVMGFHGSLVLSAFLSYMNMKLNVKIKGYYLSQYYLKTKVSMYSLNEEMEGLF